MAMRFAIAEAEMTKAVAEGKISEEDAIARLKAMKSKSKRFSREDYAKAEAKLKKLVASGEISEEDAIKRLVEMRKAMTGQAKRGNGIEKRIVITLGKAGIEGELLRKVMAVLARTLR